MIPNENCSQSRFKSMNNSLSNEINFMKTDLLRFQLLSKSYQKLFKKIKETIDLNNEVLGLNHLLNEIKVLNDCNKSQCFVSLDKLSENRLNLPKSDKQINNQLIGKRVSNIGSQTHIKITEVSTQTEIQENVSELSAEHISEIIESYELSEETSDQRIVENEFTNEDNFEEVVNNNKIIIENIRSLRNESNNESKERPEEHISEETTDKKLKDLFTIGCEVVNKEIEIDINSNIKEKTRRLRTKSNPKVNDLSDISEDNNNSETDIDFNGNEEQMSDSSQEICEGNKSKKIQTKRKINSFYCKKCSKYYLSSESLRRHLNTHSDKFMCNKCEYRANTAHRLRSHKKSLHLQRKPKATNRDSGQVFSCDNCPKSFLTSESLKRHLNTHSDKYLCNECGFRTRDGYRLGQHKRQKHSNVEPFKCTNSECKQLFKTMRQLMEHQKSVHKPNVEDSDETEGNDSHKKCVCDHIGCGKQYTLKKSLKTHKDIHSGIQYSCQREGCSAVLQIKKRLNKHITVEHTSKYLCDWEGCSYRAGSNSHLIIHKMSHSENRPYKCLINDCNKLFKTENQLNRHQLSTHPQEFDDISWIECRENGCKYRTKIKSLYNVHIRTHTRPHICPQCSKGFSRPRQLKQHMTVHSDQYKIKCEWYQCHRLFRSNSLMRLHMNIHTDEKTYPCEWPGCEKVFKLKTGWISHMNRHKGKNMYVCKLCDYRTTNTIRYKSHLKKHENQSI